MNFVDYTIIAVSLFFVASGYWSGLVTSTLSSLGMLAGAVAGMVVAPLLIGWAPPSTWTSVAAVAVALTTASLGGTIGQHYGGRTRDRATGAGARIADATAGGLVSGASTLVLLGIVGGILTTLPIKPVTEALAGSSVVAKIQAAQPDQARRLIAGFIDVADTTGFTLQADPFIPELIADAPAADPKVAKTRTAVTAGKSVLRIVGVNGCEVGLEGSGFVFASNRIMTNAHVVAGVTNPEVLMPWGPETATVVHYDPELDLAVLAVDTKKTPVLKFSDAAAVAGDEAVAIGFPENGPHTITEARIRSAQPFRTPDVYGEGVIVRDTFTLRADVRHGNSGGPLVGLDGEVIGVVFANSISGEDTGYAMTASQVVDTAAQSISATDTVDTGACID